MLHILLLLGGLALILIGANALTDGASALAKRFQISDLVIGLTIVAFGTSAPELVISVISAVNGSAEISIGNVVGSNIFNTLMIVGITALVMPIHLTKGTVRKEMPLVILSCLVLLVFGNDVLLNHDSANLISRADGLTLLLFFSIFMSYTFAIAKNPDGGTEEVTIKPMPIWKSLLYTVGGLALLILGGNWFVDGATGVARWMHISESVIGLTIAAGGTSLPELATSIVAGIKKKPGLVIGNVIGSNLFNAFFVLGTAATIRPLHMGNINNVDLLTLLTSCVVLWLVGVVWKTRTITRAEGAILVAGYIAYISFLIAHT